MKIRQIYFLYFFGPLTLLSYTKGARISSLLCRGLAISGSLRDSFYNVTWRHNTCLVSLLASCFAVVTVRCGFHRWRHPNITAARKGCHRHIHPRVLPIQRYKNTHMILYHVNDRLSIICWSRPKLLVATDNKQRNNFTSARRTVSICRELGDIHGRNRTYSARKHHEKQEHVNEWARLWWLPIKYMYY